MRDPPISDKLILMRSRTGYLWALAIFALAVSLAIVSHPGSAVNTSAGMSRPSGPVVSVESRYSTRVIAIGLAWSHSLVRKSFTDAGDRSPSGSRAGATHKGCGHSASPSASTSRAPKCPRSGVVRDDVSRKRAGKTFVLGEALKPT